MSPQIITCLVIFVASMAVYALNKLNMGVTAALTIMALLLTGCLAPETALAKFVDSNALILATMFIVAAGFGRTQLVNKLTDVIYKVGGGSFKRCLTLFLLMAWVLIPFAGVPWSGWPSSTPFCPPPASAAMSAPPRPCSPWGLWAASAYPSATGPSPICATTPFWKVMTSPATPLP